MNHICWYLDISVYFSKCSWLRENRNDQGFHCFLFRKTIFCENSLNDITFYSQIWSKTMTAGFLICHLNGSCSVLRRLFSLLFFQFVWTLKVSECLLEKDSSWTDFNVPTTSQFYIEGSFWFKYMTLILVITKLFFFFDNFFSYF